MTTDVDTQAPGADASGQDDVSVDEGDVTAVIQQLQTSVEKIQKEISGIYSRTDKDRNVMGELLKEFKAQSKPGVSLEDAVRLAEAVLLAKQRDASVDSTGKDEAVSDAQKPSLEKQVLDSIGLPKDDPRVLGIAEKHKGDIPGLVAAATELKISIATVSEPTGADIPTGPGAASVTKGKYTEELYLKDVAAIMNSTRPGEERIRQIAELKVQARGKGLEKY